MKLDAYLVNLINLQNTDLKETDSALRHLNSDTGIQAAILDCNLPSDDIGITSITGFEITIMQQISPRRRSPGHEY